MRPVVPSSRRGISVGTLFLLLLMVLLVGGGGTLGTLWALGVPLPFMHREPVLVRIPANFRPIAALSTVSREDLINPEARSVAYIEMRPDQTIGVSLTGFSETGDKVESQVAKALVEDGTVIFVTAEGQRIPASQATELGGALMNVSDIIGRVLARDKSPMLAFREELFLPEGTRSGVAGGIPPGMQALTIEASRLDGAHALKAGDHIDLMATIPDEHLPRFGGSDKSRLPGAALVGSSSPSRDAIAGEARLLAEDAVLVTPVRARAEPVRSSSLTQGTQVRNVPVQEVVLAVHRDDVPGLAEAMALNVDLVCIAHSGRPDGEPQEEAPSGLVPVPVSARPVAALSQIVRDDIFHPRTRRQRFIYLTPEEVAAKKIVTGFTDLVGRVAAHDILAGHFVTEAELLPAGTPPGLAAGVPPGKRAFVVEAKKFLGLSALTAGDHFDLLASSPVDLTKAGGRNGQSLYGGTGLIGALPKQADVRVLVHDGVIVAPILSSAGREAGAVSEVVVAVDPAEVPPVAEALATGVALTIVARSAQRGAPEIAASPASGDRTPEHHPLSGVKSLEVVVGSKRETVHFLGSTGRVVVNKPAAESRDEEPSPTVPTAASSNP
jgi:Flp pilus assembly protein CpaB